MNDNLKPKNTELKIEFNSSEDFNKFCELAKRYNYPNPEELALGLIQDFLSIETAGNIPSIQLPQEDEGTAMARFFFGPYFEDFNEQPKDFESLLIQVNAEIQRLGWSRQEIKDKLLERYGKKSVHLLTDNELNDWLLYLQSL